MQLTAEQLTAAIMAGILSGTAGLAGLQKLLAARRNGSGKLSLCENHETRLAVLEKQGEQITSSMRTIECSVGAIHRRMDEDGKSLARELGGLGAKLETLTSRLPERR